MLNYPYFSSKFGWSLSPNLHGLNSRPKRLVQIQIHWIAIFRLFLSASLGLCFGNYLGIGILLKRTLKEFLFFTYIKAKARREERWLHGIFFSVDIFVFFVGFSLWVVQSRYFYIARLDLNSIHKYSRASSYAVFGSCIVKPHGMISVNSAKKNPTSLEIVPKGGPPFWLIGFLFGWWVLEADLLLGGCMLVSFRGGPHFGRLYVDGI